MQNNDYNPNYVTIVDEDGNEQVLEELDRIETETGRYIALFPANLRDGEVGEVVIFKFEQEKGETYLHPIEDDTEFEEIAQIFEARYSALFISDVE